MVRNVSGTFPMCGAMLRLTSSTVAGLEEGTGRTAFLFVEAQVWAGSSGAGLLRVWGLCGGFDRTSPIGTKFPEPLSPQVPYIKRETPDPRSILLTRGSGVRVPDGPPGIPLWARTVRRSRTRDRGGPGKSAGGIRGCKSRRSRSTPNLRFFKVAL